MSKPSIILGIGGGLGHDANAALVVDGRLISASQEERFTRIEHEWNFPRLAILDCLNSAGLEPEQVAICAFAEKPVQSLIFDQVARSFWWLDDYQEFRKRVEACYPAVARREDTCIIFDLRQTETNATTRE
jgi:predicted NodU family carbamoyl transferase